MSNMAVQMNYGEPSRGMPGGLCDPPQQRRG